MRTHIVVALIALSILGSTLVFAIGTEAGGSENGAFPDRIFSVTKSGRDNSYSTEFSPSFNGEWWVELVSIGRGSVTVLVKEGTIAGNPVLCSTDLSKVGSESKRGYIYAGSSYLLSFTIRGGPGTAVLQEHFISDIQPPPEPPPFNTNPHPPIAIQSDADFLNPMNGVSGGTGAPEDPYVIEGWEISKSTETGIKIWFTNSYVVIKNCFVHSIGFPAHGIYLFLAANVVIENCYVESCIGNEIVVGYSHDIVLANNVIWSNLFIHYSHDCEVLGNKVREADLNLQSSTGLLLKGNTFSDSPWAAIFLAECGGVLVVHNNFVNNERNVWFFTANSISWDQGYPEGGNYWSDYLGEDENHDGIGDTPYVIDASNQDNYPLMASWSQ
jgi:hypothetical protein